MAGDRASLTAFLDYQRATLAWKCSGLSAGRLKRKAVPTSNLSLLGLVRHLAEVERSWFRSVVAGERITALWSCGTDAALRTSAWSGAASARMGAAATAVRHRVAGADIAQWPGFSYGAFTA